MSDARPDPGRPESGHPSPPLDSELSIKAIAGFAVGLVVVTVVSSAALWFGSKLLRDLEVRKDPPPPVLPAASEPYLPPAPRLQTDPIGELEALRAEEDALLGSYGWVDRDAGIARIPIERAIELRVEDAARDDRPTAGPEAETELAPAGGAAEPEGGSP